MPRATLEQIRAQDEARAFRSAQVLAHDLADRTVQLAFSSEAEVERWWGIEILSHDPDAVVMKRLDDGAPLLLQHDTDKQIGVVQSVSIDADRRGRAVVRFGRSARAEEVFQDVIDGIRRHVSVGYRIHDARVIETRNGEDVWEVTRWEPYEISIVSVPADTTVGVGRSAEVDRSLSQPPAAIQTQQPTEENMPQANQTNEQPAPETAPEPAANRAALAERERVRSIMEMGELYRAPELARDAAKDGTSVAAFQRQLLDHINNLKQAPLSEQMRAADIGMTDREVRNYSFMRVLRALTDPTNLKAQQEAAFEFEASRAAADRLGKTPEGVMVPTDVLSRALNTATTGSGSGDTGGYLVATTLLASSFVDMLRNRSTILRLGTVVGGLVGNLDIPRQTAGATGYWIGEAEDAPEQTQEFGNLPITPKTVAAYTDITRRMLRQSSIDIEGLVRSDLARALGLTIDLAGYYGKGSDKQPRGIANTTGVNAVAFQEQMPSYAELVAMETEISVDNADVNSMAYVADARFRGHAKTTLRHEGVAGTIWEPGGTVNGYRTEISNQIEKGHVFMGNFSDLLVAMWGSLELNADPYSNSKNGSLRLIAFQDIDFALRRTESFCVGKKNG